MPSNTSRNCGKLLRTLRPSRASIRRLVHPLSELHQVAFCAAPVQKDVAEGVPELVRVDLNTSVAAAVKHLVDAASRHRAAHAEPQRALFAEAGRQAEALPVSREAVELRRELTASTATPTRPDLAVSLSNYAARRTRVGRQAEEVQVAQEAVDLRHELGRSQP